MQKRYRTGHSGTRAGGRSATVAGSSPAVARNGRPTRDAAEGVRVNDRGERVILAVHVRGLDGMCAGCRLWWARLTPYPCWQVTWATSRQARASVARFLGAGG
ncbi:hypothetical protein [Micromonospora sediminicola]|uniref:hypothetical protein n=1 Tax=Micromonospora sediminicola TaxID=946078 RepID=UPI003F4CF23F